MAASGPLGKARRGWADPLRCPGRRHPSLLSGNEDQGFRDSCGSPPEQLRGWLPGVPSTVPPVTEMSWQTPPPARGSSLWPPTLRIGASQVPAAEFFLAASRALANVRQQVGRTQIGFSVVFFFLEPDGKGPFGEFLCNRLPAAPRAGGSWPGPSGSAAGWPAWARRGLGPGGPGRPASCPRRVPAAGPHAGAPVHRGPARGTLLPGLRRRPLTRSAPAGGR